MSMYPYNEVFPLSIVQSTFFIIFYFLTKTFEKIYVINLKALMNAPIAFLFKQSPVVKTETISFSSVSSGGENLEVSTKEVPVVHTETKTITYESSQVRNCKS